MARLILASALSARTPLVSVSRIPQCLQRERVPLGIIPIAVFEEHVQLTDLGAELARMPRDFA
jgi:hypothetical protein